MAATAQLLGLAEAKQPWIYETASAIALTLLVLNVLVLVGVHARRIRQSVRGRRTKRAHALIEEVVAQLEGPPEKRDVDWLRTHISRFGELERPLAAVTLIERLRPASEEERARTLDALREVGAVDSLVRSTRRWMPWRRALAIKTLGWIGAEEAVPVVIQRLSDRSRAVRESAVRALGRIGDDRALTRLGELLRTPGRVGSGTVYDALIAFGRPAEPVLARELRSRLEEVRVASCFGVATVSDPDVARSLIEPLLADESGRVRAAAAESLGQVGGTNLPEGLARASQDDGASVRVTAIRALGSYDDPRAVELAVDALRDPDRDTAIRAGESLVRLSRRPLAGAAATDALRRSSGEWTVERSLTLASLGAV